MRTSLIVGARLFPSSKRLAKPDVDGARRLHGCREARLWAGHRKFLDFIRVVQDVVPVREGHDVTGANQESLLQPQVDRPCEGEPGLAVRQSAHGFGALIE